MIEKPPHQPGAVGDLASIISWSWIVALSLLGGLAAFMRKMRANHVRVWNFTELTGEVVISGLAGLVIAHLCQWREFPMSLTYALTGIGAHMGSRALFKLEGLLDTKFPASKGDDNAP